MRKTPLLLLSLALLTACQSAPQTPPDAAEQDEIPFVPRDVSPLQTCPATGAGHNLTSALVSQLGPYQLDRGNVVRAGLQAQTASGNTVWDLLYDTKVLLNILYFGHSSVDLQALHDQTYTKFKKTFTKALSTYTIDSRVDPLMDEYLNSLQDGHTAYLNAEQYQAYVNGSQNAPLPRPVFGVSLSAVQSGDGTLVTDVRGDGPAYAAGVRRGDVILKVDGAALKRTVQPVQTPGGLDDTQQETIYSGIIATAAAKRTPVSVVLRRGNVQRSVTLTGQELNALRYPWGEFLTAPSGKTVYYLRLPTFSGPTRAGTKPIGQVVHELIGQAQTQNASGVVVDLRSNGGGLLSELIAVAGAFSPDKATQQIQYADGTFMKFWYENGQVKYQAFCDPVQRGATISNPQQWKGRIAVLVNGGSASASEMFSQVARAAGQATIIGEETYGVGNTSTFILPTPNAAVNKVADGRQAISITAGRVSVSGQPATETVKPDLNVPDDHAALAASGVDRALQEAMGTLTR